MTLLDWFRNIFSGPPHVHDTTDDAREVNATLGEEYGEEDTGPLRHTDPVKQMEQHTHWLPNAEMAEAAADDLESMEAPPDPDP